MTTWGAIRLSAGVIVTCLGSVILLLSIPAAISAATIEASLGRTGVVAQPLGTLAAAPGDRAVVVDDVTVRLLAPDVPPWATTLLDLAGTDAQDIAEGLGDVLLVATPAQDTAIFIGVAPVDAVNGYLDGTPYSVAVRPASGVEGEWPTVSVPGDAVPADPGGASIWAASATGSAPELTGTSVAGSTLVLMRADAAPGPEASLRLEYRVAGADRALVTSAVAAAGMSIGGLLLVLLGGWLIVGRKPRH
jgi:hypothetical protein